MGHRHKHTHGFVLLSFFLASRLVFWKGNVARRGRSSLIRYARCVVSVRFISCQREIHQKFLGMCSSMARGGLGLALLLGGFPITKNAYYRDLRGHVGSVQSLYGLIIPAIATSSQTYSRRRRFHRGMFLCPEWLSLSFFFFLTPVIERNRE